eukprot:3543708-Pyramimonas_sp.AAC.1
MSARALASRAAAAYMMCVRTAAGGKKIEKTIKRATSSAECDQAGRYWLKGIKRAFRLAESDQAGIPIGPPRSSADDPAVHPAYIYIYIYSPAL